MINYSLPAALALVLSTAATAAGPQARLCPVLPSDHVWNARIDSLPRHPDSDALIATISATRGIHPDFGTVYEGAPIGIPYVIVPSTQARVPITFDYADESDPGPYPIPADAPIEGGADSDGDRHVLVIDYDCILYELFDAHRNADGSWHAGSGARFDLRSNALRPSGWTSADAAGLPIMPGLVRYDEVADGEIAHALRFTAPVTREAFIWPARHQAGSQAGSPYPPMGLRVRLKSSFDISTFSPPVQVILRAMQRYGMVLADNGSAWFVSGAPDSRWNDDMLVSELGRVKGSDFEAVDEGSLQKSADSAAVKGNVPADWVVTEFYNTGLDHFFVTAFTAEAGFVDSGGAGPGWQRTGATSARVWSTPPSTDFDPVCRFYGNPAIGSNGRRVGPNSHFYTIEPGECAAVKTDPGWVFEANAFYARRLVSGACPSGTRALYRAYNNGFPTKDANHRFALDLATLQPLVAQGWVIEGAVMCVQ